MTARPLKTVVGQLRDLGNAIDYPNEAALCHEAADLIERLATRAEERVSPSQPGVEGWKLVPVEPTEAMLGAGVSARNVGRGVGDIYFAMLSASPAPTPAGVGEGGSSRDLAPQPVALTHPEPGAHAAGVDGPTPYEVDQKAQAMFRERWPGKCWTGHGNAFRNHIAKRDVHRVRVGRKYWHFTFSERWGPLLTDEWGEPVNNGPLADEEHPFWDSFEGWQAALIPGGAE